MEPRRPTGKLGIPEAFALVAAASFLAARFLPVLEAGPACPFRSVTGLPCATCGMTHAFVALARGDLAAAWAASPLGALLAGGAWLYAVLDAGRVALRLPWPGLTQRAWRALAVAAVSATAVNWAWMLWRARAS
jgi:Protein of unknown function (DUF2752)